MVRIRSVPITVERRNQVVADFFEFYLHRQRVFMQTEPYTAVAPYLTSKDTRRRQYYLLRSAVTSSPAWRLGAHVRRPGLAILTRLGRPPRIVRRMTSCQRITKVEART
ncbi:hypothetical protein C8Q76DRAFT_699608 [Earliella scabrosa]|nr:hypothetical protein C8Q76DRAFT_699608 [Earliella scabrosa]